MCRRATGAAIRASRNDTGGAAISESKGILLAFLCGNQLREMSIRAAGTCVDRERQLLRISAAFASSLRR